MSQYSAMAPQGGANYEPLQPAYDGIDPYGPHDVPMQGQYPTGPAMSTFGGNGGFGGPPPPPPGGMEMGMTMEHGHADPHGGHGHSKIDTESGMAPRRCTDVQTFGRFIIFAILAFTLLGVAGQHGNIGRLNRGTDYFGRVCGVDAGVENMPFLFWCRADAPSQTLPTGIDLDRPSCVAYCPTSYNVNISCVQKAQKQSSIVPGPQFGIERTQVVTMQQSIVQAFGYPTHPRGGRYCIPQDAVLADTLLSSSRGLGPFSYRRWLTAFGTLRHLYWLMLCSTILSILLGYGFIYCIKHCPYTLAKVFLLPLALFLIGVTGWCWMSIGPLTNPDGGFARKFYVPRNDMFKHWEYKKACYINIGIGFVTFAIAGSFIGMAMNFKSIGITDLMNASFDTFRAVPSLVYVPAFEGVAKFLVFWMGLGGFQTILAEGWIEKNRIHVNGAKFAGLTREFTPSLHDWRFYAMATVWILFIVWLLECLTALSQFITSYCTFKYFGIKKEGGKKPPLPGNTVLQGLKLALIYHPGSILRGAMTVPLYRPVRILHWMSAASGAEQSCLTKINCIGDSCCKALHAWTTDSLGEGPNQASKVPIKDGFDDVVVRANDFDKASEQAHNLLEHSHKIVQYLYRDHSQTTINIIGVCSISSLSAMFVYLVVVNVKMFNQSTSALYVADPYMLTVLTALLSAYIAFGFMTLWDHTADTLLFCYCWARKWNRKTVEDYLPDALKYIVGNDHTEHDRYPYYGKAKNNMYLSTFLPMVGMDKPKK